MAEGVFQNMASSHPLIAQIDSSGTGAYHVGDTPDPRTMRTLTGHGITDYVHYAQKLDSEHFLKYDYLIAMDEWNLRDLLRERELVRASLNKGKGPASLSRATRGGAAAALQADAPSTGTRLAEVRLFGDFLPGGLLHERVGGGEVVQDPYYGGPKGFETVYGQVVRFSRNFLDHVEKSQKSHG